VHGYGITPRSTRNAFWYEGTNEMMGMGYKNGMATVRVTVPVAARKKIPSSV
jgi:hypothetical protein